MTRYLIQVSVEILLKKLDADEGNKLLCKFCNLLHKNRKDTCAAFENRCHKCRKENRFAARCKMKTAKCSKLNYHIFNNYLFEYVKFESQLHCPLRGESRVNLISAEETLKNTTQLRKWKKIKKKKTVLSQTVCGAPYKPNGLFQ